MRIRVSVAVALLAVVAAGGYVRADEVRVRAESLARRWCDALIARQINCLADRRIDGAIACPACGFSHGRVADLVYPLVFFYVKTGETKYLEAARRAINWRELMMVRQNGGAYNDYKSLWCAITAFSQISIGETLLAFGDKIPPDFQSLLRDIFRRESEFLDGLFDAAFLAKVNVNYPAAMCEAMILAHRIYGEERWKRRAAEIRQRLSNAFLEDGLLRGEGHPIEQLSVRGRAFVDLGYNLEESLPALYQYARISGDSQLESEIVRSFRAHLEFLLPDGAIDNSCGSRAEKWTYYGSRTSDGALAFFAQMALRGVPGAWTAVERHLALLERCTGEDGLLAGGLGYGEAEEPACVHHAMVHVKSLVRFLSMSGLDDIPQSARGPLPREREYGIKSFDSMGVVLASTGPWRVTFSSTDAFMNIGQGNLYVSGGSPAVVWNRLVGPVAIGTMPFYKMTEAHNMQDLRKERQVLSMTPRLEAGSGSSVADGAAEFCSGFTNGVFQATAKGHLTSISGKSTSSYCFDYRIDGDDFIMKATSEGEAKFVFPVVIGGKDEVTYSGGIVRVKKPGGRVVTLTANRDLKPIASDRGERAFSPVGGFLYTCASAVVPAGESICVKVTCLEHE